MWASLRALPTPCGSPCCQSRRAGKEGPEWGRRRGWREPRPLPSGSPAVGWRLEGEREERAGQGKHLRSLSEGEGSGPGLGGWGARQGLCPRCSSEGRPQGCGADSSDRPAFERGSLSLSITGLILPQARLPGPRRGPSVLSAPSARCCRTPAQPPGGLRRPPLASAESQGAGPGAQGGCGWAALGCSGCFLPGGPGLASTPLCSRGGRGIRPSHGAVAGLRRGVGCPLWGLEGELPPGGICRPAPVGPASGVSESRPPRRCQGPGRPCSSVGWACLDQGCSRSVLAVVFACGPRAAWGEHLVAAPGRPKPRRSRPDPRFPPCKRPRPSSRRLRAGRDLREGTAHGNPARAGGRGQCARSWAVPAPPWAQGSVSDPRARAPRPLLSVRGQPAPPTLSGGLS